MTDDTVIQATLTVLDAVLKDRPLVDSVQEALNKATPFAEEITQELTLSGRQGIFPAQFGVNEGIYTVAEGGTFPPGASNTPLLAKVKARFIYAIFEITGPLMSAARDNPGSFEDGLALQIENTIDGLKLDAARMYLGDGFGIFGTYKGQDSSTVHTFEKPYGIGKVVDQDACDLATTYKGSQTVRFLIRKDQFLDVLSDGAVETQKVGAHKVSSVAQVASTSDVNVTWASAEDATPAVGDYLRRAAALTSSSDTGDTTNESPEIQGFLAGVQDGSLAGGSSMASGMPTFTYFNIARSGNLGWQGIIVDAAAGGGSAVALSADDLRDTVDLIAEQSGQDPEFMIGGYKQRRNVYNLSAPQIRYAPMQANQGLDEQTVRFDNMRFLPERFFPPEHIGFVNSRFWYHAIDKDVEWIQGVNGTVLHFLQSSDVYRAVLRTYRNMVCLFPAAQGLLWGLSE